MAGQAQKMNNKLSPMVLVGEEKAPPVLSSSKTSCDVFDKTTMEMQCIKVKKRRGDASSPPNPLLIFQPAVIGTYPVLLFLHGYALINKWYSQLPEHISSHGYIVVAPGEAWNLVSLYHCCCFSDDVHSMAAVTDWLGTYLESNLTNKVKPDLQKLALAGHSKGGKTAFGLALGLSDTTLQFSALIGIDPVDGTSVNYRPDPKILKYIPRSLHLEMPVAIIGAGLSSQGVCLIPPFAANGVNHSQFFGDSDLPSYYFLATNYGHVDMLNDRIAELISVICKSGNDRDKMRRGVGGIVVAFLNAYLGGDKDCLEAIVDHDPAVPVPLSLDPIIYVGT